MRVETKNGPGVLAKYRKRRGICAFTSKMALAAAGGLQPQ